MLKVSTNINATNYGDSKINKLLMGEINPGSLVLLDGESDTGKSILCQQLAYNALYHNTRSVAYFTSDNKPNDLLDQMESFSFHVHYHFVSDRFRIYPLKLVNNNPYISESARLLLHCLDDLPSSFTLAIIDDINPLLVNMNVETQLMALRDIKLLCKKNLRSVILVTNPYVFSRNNLSRMYALCDYYLHTDTVAMTPGIEQMDCRTMRMLEVRKMGGVEMGTGQAVLFDIQEGTGIQIMPYVTVKA